jgi:hypothetical protein
MFTKMTKEEILYFQNGMDISDPAFYQHHCIVCGEALGFIDEDENGLCRECEEEECWL